jgi:hypothetical protein
VKRFATGSSASLEERLYTALVRSANQLGDDWPSEFRNVINYHTGFAYTAVRREQVLKSLRYLRQPRTYELEAVLERFERSLTQTRTRAAILAAPQVIMELLVDLTFIVHALATELHGELIDRHGLDGRWQAARRRFVRSNGLVTPEGAWPLGCQ